MNQIVPITPVVRVLIIINVVVWLGLQMIIERFFLHDPYISEYLSLIPSLVVHKFFVWQLFTYMFLHSSNVMHILFNMLMLWWLGGELEQRWGSRFFITYYLVSGVGAAIIYVLGILVYTLISGSIVGWNTPVVGASGAIFGLLIAYGLIFGERIVHFMMIFPMKARYFVMILGAVEVMNLINSGVAGSDVATLAHLGGLLSGFLFLKFYTRFQQSHWRKKGSKRGRGLKLVVNNDKKDKDGPRYWN
jgi:membrane associated rhomboid family serine protease